MLWEYLTHSHNIGSITTTTGKTATGSAAQGAKMTLTAGVAVKLRRGWVHSQGHLLVNGDGIRPQEVFQAFVERFAIAGADHR